MLSDTKSTLNSFGDTRSTTANAPLGPSVLSRTPRGQHESAYNLNCVILETQNVSQRHVLLGEALEIDRQHLNSANDDLIATREEIAKVTKRLKKNQGLIEKYDSDIAPLLTAYDKAIEGLAKTYEYARVGHGKGKSRSLFLCYFTRRKEFTHHPTNIPVCPRRGKVEGGIRLPSCVFKGSP